MNPWIHIVTIQTKDFILILWSWWNNKWTPKAQLIHPLKRLIHHFSQKRQRRNENSNLTSQAWIATLSKKPTKWGCVSFLPVCFRVYNYQKKQGLFVVAKRVCVCVCVCFNKKSSLGPRKTQRRKRSTMKKKQIKKTSRESFFETPSSTSKCHVKHGNLQSWPLYKL